MGRGGGGGRGGSGGSKMTPKQEHMIDSIQRRITSNQKAIAFSERKIENRFKNRLRPETVSDHRRNVSGLKRENDRLLAEIEQVRSGKHPLLHIP